ncbi:hypothetical protein BDZ89DRAFT_1146680 [Hymenopellis radicata]|nr:hypothetical protein BDZ89DRAFT_1146680 [Hymenopellis radicata]
MPNLGSNTNTGGLSPGVQAFLGQYNTLKPEDRALVEGKLQEIMAQTNALPAFISPSANNSGVEDQVPKRFPSATNGHTALPDGSPMKVDDMSLPASPAVDEELPDYDDFTSESRLSNSPRLEDRSSMEIETDIVFTQVCGALLPTLLDEGGIPFLRRIRPALKKLATGDFEYPTWMPEDAANMPADVREHFTALKIPRLHGSRTPCLLLHDLGSNSDQEVGNLAKMLSTFVDKVHHKCFVNCSGSGKTRLCLESLCLEYGLYFTCAQPGLTTDDLGGLGPQIGSRDLASVNDILINHKSFTQNLRHVPDPVQAGITNSTLAGSYLVNVLVARLIIFLEYLGCLSKEQLHSLNAKRAWMYLQVQPFLDDIPDVFVTFARHVLPERPDEEVNPVSAICKQIASVLGCPDNLFSFPIVIDEAQLGAVALGDAFLSSINAQNEVNTRPILKSIQTHSPANCLLVRHY